MNKILLIRFSSIGDIVLTSAVVRCLRQQLGVEIHYLTKANFKGLMSSNPYVSEVIAWEDEQSSAILERLKSESYDAIIDLHKNLRSLKIRSALQTSVYTFDKLNLEKWLMVNLKWNRLPDQHLVDRYFSGISTIGVKNDEKGLDFFIPDSTSNIKDLLTGSFLEAGYYGLALGAAHATKQIPDDKLLEICKSIDGKIVLLGGPAESKKGKWLSEEFPGKVINTAGKTTINESARIIEHCRLLITPDTGMMHIAAALKKPIIAVWGNTIPAFGMYPYFPEHDKKFKNIQIENLSCRPCSKIGKSVCPKGHFNCMKSIEIAEILAAITALDS